MRFTEDSFDPEQPATIGVDYKTKIITVDGNTVKLSIWVNISTYTVFAVQITW
jgi:Ras-related protein Rab-18